MFRHLFKSNTNRQEARTAHNGDGTLPKVVKLEKAELDAISGGPTICFGRGPCFKSKTIKEN